MHLSGRPLAKPYRTRAFFLRIFLPACKKLVVLGHFSFQFELRFFLIWSWSIPVGASKIRCSTRAFAVSKAAVTDHSRHESAKCEQDSKSGSRASGSWVRIPPYPPRSRQQSVFPAAGVSFCAKSNRRPISAARRHPITDPLCDIYSGRQTTFAVYTARAMKRLVRGTSAKVTYQLHEPFQSMGSVSVTGKNIDMKKVVWFVRSVELASKSVVYPKTDGTVCMTFPFHGLTRPIE